jgi:hypothetical protein
MTVSYPYASFADIDVLLKTPRKSPLGRRHEKFSAEIYVGDYVNFPSMAVNYDRMEVSPKSIKQEMSVFSVPINSRSLIIFEKRRVMTVWLWFYTVRKWVTLNNNTFLSTYLILCSIPPN